MIKAVIFDMDGVLIDAKEWHFKALNNALSLFGYEISHDEHLLVYDGLPTKKKLEILSAKHGFPIGLYQFVNDLKQQYTQDLITLNCKPYFPHQFLLSRLKKHGYKLAVASNSIKITVETMLKAANIYHYFDYTLSNNDVKKSKPNPDIYLKATHLLGVLPSESLVLEDNDNGIKAAESAGCHLLKIQTIQDVNLENVLNRIESINTIK